MKKHTNLCIVILLETQGKLSCKSDTTRTYLQAQQRSIYLSHSKFYVPYMKKHTNVCIAILLETQGKLSCSKCDTTRTYLQAQQRSIYLSHMHARTHAHNHCSTCTFIPPQTCHFSVWVSPQIVYSSTLMLFINVAKFGVITAMKVYKIQLFLIGGAGSNT
jgi:hypothetical protein